MNDNSFTVQALAAMVNNSRKARRQMRIENVMLDITTILGIAWLVMLIFGVLHHDVIRSVQPAGYGTCLVLSFLGCMAARGSCLDRTRDAVRS